ncbi:VOC family protein [Lewinella sp. 4G2]|uniref:VOC family protein n=1 Tax=Lewinella sp. 4G2 TaxID=1803372 RepID=UPI0007B45D33|nr:VOC family protein [Lewinella sp. 4G2]OAV44615.1 hypothetical protein A3850_008975 [Lewinella sp. 4G2]
MDYADTGFILYVVEYEASVRFYEEVLSLPVLYRKDGLVCFSFGSAYLMVELDDRKGASARNDEEPNRTCLRLNVLDLQAARRNLDQHDIDYTYAAYSWGTVMKFRDPAGNLVAYRSASEHRADIDAFKSNPY